MNQSYYNMNSIYNSFTRMAMPELEGQAFIHSRIPKRVQMAGKTNHAVAFRLK